MRRARSVIIRAGVHLSRMLSVGSTLLVESAVCATLPLEVSPRVVVGLPAGLVPVDRAPPDPDPEVVLSQILAVGAVDVRQRLREEDHAAVEVRRPEGAGHRVVAVQPRVGLPVCVRTSRAGHSEHECQASREGCQELSQLGQGTSPLGVVVEMNSREIL